MIQFFDFREGHKLILGLTLSFRFGQSPNSTICGIRGAIIIKKMEKFGTIRLDPSALSDNSDFFEFQYSLTIIDPLSDQFRHF